MRLLLLLLLSSLASSNFANPTLQSIESRTDRVVIKPRTLVIIRTGKLIKDFPEKKRATIRYPVVTGLSERRVLRRVQAILEIKNAFDTSVAEYRQDNWLEDFNYEVNYNKNYILDLTFRQEGAGAYPDSQTKHFAINLKNGTIIKAADAFAADKLNALRELVDRKLQAELHHILVDLNESKSDPEDVRIAKEAQESLEYKPEDLDQFEVSDKGITFLYDAGYPHAIQAFEPEGRYFFNYAELRRFINQAGPLGQFVK